MNYDNYSNYDCYDNQKEGIMEIEKELKDKKELLHYNVQLLGSISVRLEDLDNEMYEYRKSRRNLIDRIKNIKDEISKLENEIQKQDEGK